MDEFHLIADAYIHILNFTYIREMFSLVYEGAFSQSTRIKRTGLYFSQYCQLHISTTIRNQRPELVSWFKPIDNEQIN